MKSPFGILAVLLYVCLPVAAQDQNPIRVNAGGPAYKDSKGQTWSADHGYNTGELSNSARSATVVGTTDPTLFKSARYSESTTPELQYQFALTKGIYTVNLYFAETFWKATGKRIFDVQIQGATVVHSLDIFAAVGADHALVKSALVSVANGTITIRFVHHQDADNPIVSAIEILPKGTSATVPSISVQPASETVTAGQTAKFSVTADGTAPLLYQWRKGGVAISGATSATYTTPATSTTNSGETFLVVVSNSAGSIASNSATLTVNRSAVTTTSLPSGTVGTAYSTTLQASGGTAPYTWSISSGSLPAGLSLVASTGVISGTPTTTGTVSFTVQVKDAANNTGTKALSIAVAAAAQPPTVTTTSLPSGTVGTAYSTTLQASGGTAPYTWSISSGSLPAGLSLVASTGVISGTPTAVGQSSFTVQVSDSVGGTGTQTLTLAVVSSAALDSYGGRLDLNCTNKTSGWASMSLVGSHYFVCDPEGHPQWWVGMYAFGNIFNSTTDRNNTSYTTYFVNKYGDADVNWSDKELGRIAGWGFNGLATYATVYPQPFYNNSAYGGSGWHTKQIPTTPNVRPGIYAIYNNDSDLPCVAGDSSDCDPPKNVINVYSPFAQAQGMRAWSDGHQLSDWYDSRTYQWVKNELAAAGNGVSGNFSMLKSNISQLSWVYAILLDDSDQLPDASCSPQYPCVNPPNNIGPSKGMLTLTASPVMAANNKAINALHFDPIVYDKRHMLQSLITEYESISALNAAWGSNYTTFNSSGTCIGPAYNTSPATCDTISSATEAHGTGSGGAGPYNFTLNNSQPTQLSVIVKFNGTPVAGDTPGPSGAYSSTGTIWGPNVTGTIDYATGAISVTANSTSHPIWRVKGNGSGTISWYCDQQECGVWPGQDVTISGTSNYNASCVVLSLPAPTAYTASCTQSGNTHTDVESGTLAPSSVVSTAVNISVDYIQNGWSIGTGLADEDGRASHGWIGTDYLMQTGQTSELKADEDQAIQDLYTEYFEQGCTQIHAVFGAHMMCWGPDSLYRKGVISRYPILKAVKAANQAGLLDAVVSQGFYGAAATISNMMADIGTYQGEVPVISGEFWTANSDSYFAAPVTATSCSGGNVTVTVPTTLISTNSGSGAIGVGNGGYVNTQGMFNSSYNTGGTALEATNSTATTVTYGPVSCGANGAGGSIALEDYYENEPNNFSTQAARGTAYFNKLQEYLTVDKLPTTGHYIVAGVEFWGFQDNIPEGLDWGWVSVADNAYDGTEDVKSTGAACDSTPEIGSKCGGELMNHGNFIGGPTGAAAANHLWLGITP